MRTLPQHKRTKPHYFLLCHSPTNYLFTTDFYFRFLSTFTPTFTPDFYFHFLFTSASYLPPLFIPTFYPLFTSSFYLLPLAQQKSQGKIPDRTKKYKVPAKMLFTITNSYDMIYPSARRQGCPLPEKVVIK